MIVTKATARTKLVVALGRGKTGKSVFLRWVTESAREAGADVRVLDADPDNKALSSCFPDAETLPPGDGEDRRLWLEDRLNAMVEAAKSGKGGYHAVLDVGGNDRLLRALGAEVGLVDLLEESGIDTVAVHMLGPDEADLRYLEDVEATGSFKPKSVVLVLNAGLLRTGQSVNVAFRPIMDSAIAKRVLSDERGGKWAMMPSLACIREVDQSGIRSFREAATAVKQIGLFNARRIAFWLDRDMPELRAKLAGFLP